MHIFTFQLSNVQEYVTIGICWSEYKAEMQNVKVVYFTELTIIVIATYLTYLFTKINFQPESTKFGCLGNDCEEHFPKEIWFCEDVTFLGGWKYTKENTW